MLVQQLLAHVAKVGHITCGTLPLARPRIFPRGTDGSRCHIATAVRTCGNPALHSTGWDVGKEKFGRARIEEVATSSGSADSSNMLSLSVSQSPSNEYASHLQNPAKFRRALSRDSWFEGENERSREHCKLFLNHFFS